MKQSIRKSLLGIVTALFILVTLFSIMPVIARAEETTAYPEVDSSNIVGKDYYATSSFWIANKTATTSEWIFLEWKNDASNTTKRTAGGWTYGVALGDGTLKNVTADNSNIWHDFGTHFFGAESAGKKVLIVVNTTTGQIDGYIDGTLKESATRSVEGLSEFKIRAGVNSAYTCNSTIYNFKAYDGEGNDLGVDTDMLRQVPDIELEGEINAKNYKTKEKFYIVNATATTSEWVFFEFDNLTTSKVALGDNTCYWYQSVQDDCANVYVDNKNITNGIAKQYNNTDQGVKAFNNDTEETIHTIIAIDTVSGTSYLKQNDGGWVVLLNFGGEGKKGDYPNTEKSWYAGFCVNSGVEYVEVENLKCYDEDGNDLGIATSLKRVVTGGLGATIKNDSNAKTWTIVGISAGAVLIVSVVLYFVFRKKK